MKGIVLAGGSGTRLYPLTKAISKQLLPVYKKPMIFYPISTLMLAGIRDILIISTPRDIVMLKDLMGDGSEYGVRFSYAIQDRPNGIAEAFILGEEFIDGDSVALVLGDNFFYGQGFTPLLRQAAQIREGAAVLSYPVANPSQFGVIETKDDIVISLIEKPKVPVSNLAVTGLYFYDKQVCDFAHSVTPSERGELEITDLNQIYLSQSKLKNFELGRGFTWMDMGTHDSLMRVSNFVYQIENNQGFEIANLDEIAFSNGWISAGFLRSKINKMDPVTSEYIRKFLGEQT